MSLNIARRRLISAAVLFLCSACALHAQKYVSTGVVLRDIDAAVIDASDYYHVDRKLIYVVVKVESNNNPWAVSKRGALGLMQLKPETAWSLGVRNPFNPRENVFAGTLYLETLLAKYHNVDLALAAYNAGAGKVDSHRGIPPYRETIRYINRITYLYHEQRFNDLRQLTESIASDTLGEHKPSF